MDTSLQQHLDNLKCTDKELRYASFRHLIEITNQPVDWAYDVWDNLLLLMQTGDNHQRTIAVQLLSNLAKSDPQQRMPGDLDKLLQVTKDEKFVTARHSLQALWKVGVASKALREKVTQALSNRFQEGSTEKNGTLIRYDIMEVFRKIFDQVQEEEVKETALALLETEGDAKYRKKYLGLWKDVLQTSKNQL